MIRRAIAAGIAGALVIVPAANAKPCEKHTDTTKVTKAACMKEVKREQARARMAWPPNPTVSEIRTRVNRIGGPGTWEKAWRIAQCETGANPRHFPHGRWIGMMGMYRSTYAYGARRTGYPYPATATPQQQIAVAVAAWPITRQWQGWGCRGA